MKLRNDQPGWRCIELFADFQKAIGQPLDHFRCRPDETEQGDIDAILGSNDAPISFAIEHASFNVWRESKKLNSLFGEVFGELEAEFRNALGYRLAISLERTAIQKGPNRAAIKEAFHQWVKNESRHLSDGSHTLSNVPGIPFQFTAIKGGLLQTDGVVIGRTYSDESDLGNELKDLLIRRHDKLTKLRAHRTESRRTTLLLESRLEDTTLINAANVAAAWDMVFPTWPETLDVLWYVDNVEQARVLIHDLRGGRSWYYDVQAKTIMGSNMQTARVRARFA